MRSKKYVLDSYAVLAVIEGETGAQIVADIVAGEETELYMSIISLGEIYYILLRRKGEQSAEEVVQNTLAEDSLTIADVSWPRVKEAALFKPQGGLSYADAFVLALGKELKAPVVTGDPEIRTAATKAGVEIVWIGSI